MIIERALEEARDALFLNGQTDVNWVDALLEIANRSLDAIAAPTRRNRFRINMNLDTDRSRHRRRRLLACLTRSAATSPVTA